jgi:hypothetical protein
MLLHMEEKRMMLYQLDILASMTLLPDGESNNQSLPPAVDQ